MTPKIVELDQVSLVGISIETNLSETKTQNLWKEFMQQVSSVTNRVNDSYYSVQVYPEGMTLDAFTPITTFKKWAAVAVDNLNNIPKGMDTLVINTGKYAVFKHKGIASDFFRTSQEIFGIWLPKSGFQLADRPHFEIMGPCYKGPHDSDSEEDVYIPIQ